MKVNLFGVYTFLISLLSSLPYYLGLTLTKAYLESLPEEERDNYRLYDDVGKAWSKGFLAATFSYPGETLVSELTRETTERLKSYIHQSREVTLF